VGLLEEFEELVHSVEAIEKALPKLDISADTTHSVNSNKKQGKKIYNPPQQNFSQLFDAPSHVLPPPSSLYKSFMELLLRKDSSSTENQMKEDKMDIQTENQEDPNRMVPHQQNQIEGEITTNYEEFDSFFANSFIDKSASTKIKTAKQFVGTSKKTPRKSEPEQHNGHTIENNKKPKTPTKLLNGNLTPKKTPKKP